MKKEKIYSTVLLMLSITFALVIGEIVAKVYVESTLRYWTAFVPDEKTGWRLKENSEFDVEWWPGTKQHMVTNEFGYRDSNSVSEINPGSVVISIQGASNILGFGVQSENLLSNILEEQLNKDARNDSYHVINAAVSGYDLQHSVLQSGELFEAYQPTYNFLFITMEKDFLYTLLSTPYSVPRPFYDLVDGELKLFDREFRVRRQQYLLKFIPSMMGENRHITNYSSRKYRGDYIEGFAAQSYLAYLLGRSLGTSNDFSKLIEFFHVDPSSLAKSIGFVRVNPKNVSDEEYREAYAFAKLAYFQENWPPVFDHGQELITKLFAKYRDPQVTKTVVILLPDRREMLDREELNNEVIQYLGPSATVHFEPYYKRMKQSIVDAGLDYIDLRHFFLKEKEPSQLYLPGNNHIGPRGHELVARIIFNYIADRRAH